MLSSCHNNSHNLDIRNFLIPAGQMTNLTALLQSTKKNKNNGIARKLLLAYAKQSRAYKLYEIITFFSAFSIAKIKWSHLPGPGIR